MVTVGNKLRSVWGIGIAAMGVSLLLALNTGCGPSMKLRLSKMGSPGSTLGRSSAYRAPSRSKSISGSSRRTTGTWKLNLFGSGLSSNRRSRKGHSPLVFMAMLVMGCVLLAGLLRLCRKRPPGRGPTQSRDGVDESWLLLLLLVGLFMAGCEVPDRLKAETEFPEVREVEPSTGCGYWVYVPSYYSHEKVYPLVVSVRRQRQW